MKATNKQRETLRLIKANGGTMTATVNGKDNCPVYEAGGQRLPASDAEIRKMWGGAAWVEFDSARREIVRESDGTLTAYSVTTYRITKDGEEAAG